MNPTTPHPDRPDERTPASTGPARTPHNTTGHQPRTWLDLFFRTSIFRISMWGQVRTTVADVTAPLPPASRALVESVVRRTRLRRRERLEVAHELTSHFTEGLAAGTGEQELLRAFGPTNSAAKLIRRGMRRKRSTVWHLWFYSSRSLAAGIALFVALYAWLYVRAIYDQPTITRNYLAEWNAPLLAIPESDRALPLYVRANQAFRQTPDAARIALMLSVHDPASPEFAELRAFFTAHGEVLDLIRSGAAKPVLGLMVGTPVDPAWETRFLQAPPVEPSRAAAPLPGLQNPESAEAALFNAVPNAHFSMLRQHARLLSQDASIAAADGAAARVLSDWQALAGLGRHAAMPRTLIGQLVSAAVHMLLLDRATRTLYAAPDLFTPEQLRDLAHLVASLSLGGDPGDLTFDLTPEFDGIADVIQRVYTDDGHGNGRLAPRGIMTLSRELVQTFDYGPLPVAQAGAPASVGPLAPLLVAVAADRREAMDTLDRLRAAFAAQRRIPLSPIDPDSPLARFERETLSGWAAKRNVVLAMLMPATGSALNHERRLQQSRGATLAAIALAAFHREHRAWPSSLDQLVPAYLPALPLDIFDGKPLRYRLATNGPLLYSIGSDFTDDGGITPIEPEHVNAIGFPGLRDRLVDPWSPGVTVPADQVFWPPPPDPNQREAAAPARG